MTPDTTDESLLAGVALGQRDALASLYDRYQSLLKAIGRQLLNEAQEVEDIIHDVFIEIWRGAGDFDPKRGSARTWIVMKMRCRLIDRLRRRQRRSALLGLHQETLTPALALSPDTLLEHTHVRQAIESLPEPLREVVILTYFHGLPSSSVAQRLALPAGTVKSRLAAARRALHALLVGDAEHEDA